jgi:hypothetical protein
LYKNLDKTNSQVYLKELLVNYGDFQKGGENDDDEDDDEPEAMDVDGEENSTKKSFDKLQFNFVSLKQILLAKDVRNNLINFIYNYRLKSQKKSQKRLLTHSSQTT